MIHLDRLVISLLSPSGSYYIHNTKHACVLIIITNCENYRYAVLFDSIGCDSRLQSSVELLLKQQHVPILCRSLKVMQGASSYFCSAYCCIYLHFIEKFYFSKVQKPNIATLHAVFSQLFNDCNVILRYETLLKQLQM
jgi:hypothetical protein